MSALYQDRVSFCQLAFSMLKICFKYNSATLPLVPKTLQTGGRMVRLLEVTVGGGGGGEGGGNVTNSATAVQN